MPGVGQIYLGYYKLGFIHNIVFASTIMVLNTRLPDPMYPLLGISLAFFFIYNVVDAVIVLRNRNFLLKDIMKIL